MYKNYLNKKGCILADDMGLGKTIQISVLIGTLIHQRLLNDVVIVSPTSIAEYWRYTIK